MALHTSESKKNSYLELGIDALEHGSNLGSGETGLDNS